MYMSEMVIMKAIATTALHLSILEEVILELSAHAMPGMGMFRLAAAQDQQSPIGIARSTVATASTRAALCST